MITVGLTGSIGMGKSTAAAMFEAMGVPVFDSDRCVHDLLAPGGAGVVPVGTAFPEAYDHKAGTIQRPLLRQALGSDPQSWDLLESLLHPLVRDAQKDFIRSHQRKGATVVVLDIPLLFEVGAEIWLDYTICVTAPAWLQERRVMNRSPISREDFAFRLSRQLPDREKRRRADFVVQTGLGRAYTNRKLKNIIRQIKGAGKKA